ncbi:MAG: lipopolysaccharide transport periplasmic protein LptA [Arcobacteraceae bacterium]|jgi:lipopolysaccharide export system protein LptA|nr:lipopolysaccharide transport periplasmic protein LptA [Arcobacteraceae bacterium]MDY0328762.1 LptA/OstA family protein [Arcobacteraceae bacterium]
MKYALTFVLLFSFVFAQDNLIIDANNFEADDQKGIAIFTGNVKVTKIKDKLNSDKLVVEMTTNSQNEKTPKKYTATGNVDFTVYSQEKIYLGKGTKVIYEPLQNKYTILGNGYLEEQIDGRILYGEEIYLDEITGSAQVVGNETKPVRFIMKIQE